MTELLEWVNRAVTLLFAALLAPFAALDPVWPLVFVSALTALLMVWVFGRFSDQGAVATIRDRLRAHLLSVRLYRHDPRVVFGIQAQVMRDTWMYLRLTVRPLLVMSLPLALILIQTDARFSVRPLHPGEASVVTAKFAGGGAGAAPALTASPELLVETEGVRIPEQGEVSWRVRAVKAGDAWVQLLVDGKLYRKKIAVGSSWQPVAVERGGSLGDVLMNPLEKALPSGAAVRSLRASYLRLAITVGWWDLGWLTVFLVCSLGFALLLRRPMGVEF